MREAKTSDNLLGMILRRNLLLALVVICGLPALAVSTQQSPPADVSILLSARDKYDRVITNLKKEDIRIFEDGALRPITMFENADDLPISIEVLIDTSGSTKNQSAAVPVLAKLFLGVTMRKGKDMATVTSFGSSVSLVQSVTDDVTHLYSAIDKIVMQTATGRTPLYAAIRDAANRLAAVPGRRIVLVVSDGMDTSDASWKKMIETLQKNDVAVYPMYCFCNPVLPGEPTPLRFNLDTWGMTELAKATGGTAYLPGTGGAQAIERDLRQIAREMAAQRVVSFQPGRYKNSQSLRKIRIEVANPDLKGLKFKYRERY
jgi:Ca-activated chloride channel family protein